MIRVHLNRRKALLLPILMSISLIIISLGGCLQTYDKALVHLETEKEIPILFVRSLEIVIDCDYSPQITFSSDRGEICIFSEEITEDERGVLRRYLLFVDSSVETVLVELSDKSGSRVNHSRIYLDKSRDFPDIDVSSNTNDGIYFNSIPLAFYSLKFVRTMSLFERLGILIDLEKNGGLVLLAGFGWQWSEYISWLEDAVPDPVPTEELPWKSEFAFDIEKQLYFNVLTGEDNSPPVKPHSPLPENNSLNQPLEILLDWYSEDLDGDSLFYDLYFGTQNNLELIDEGLCNHVFYLSNLKHNTRYFWKVVVRDGLYIVEGDVWSFETLVPNIPPLIGKMSGMEGTIGEDNNTFSWTGNDPDGEIVRFELRKDSGEWADAALYTEYPWNGYSEGEHTFEVRALDNEGAYSEIIGWTFTYDPPNVPPAVTKTGGLEGETEESSNTFSWTGNDPDGSITLYEYRKDGGSWTEHGLNTTYTWIGYSEGNHTFEVRAQDNDGAYSNVIGWNFVFDRPNIPPVIEKVSGTEGTTGEEDNTFSWDGDDPDGSITLYEYRKDGGSWTGHGLNTSYTWSGYSEGSHTFEVRAQDNDGAYSNVIGWNFTYNAAAQETGGFKVANSWGIGGWENVPDGFLYITYEAMKQNKVLCFVVDPKDNYEPRAIAVFKISHPVRDDCYVYVGVGNPSSPSREKRFDDYIQRSGPYPYPDNKMVLDITELLPFNNETLYLKVYDTKTGSTGTIEFFSVEIYDNYPSGVPSSVFISTQTPKNTVNNSYVNVQIPGVTVSAVSNYDLSSNTGGLSKRLLEGMKETMGVYEEGRDYNEIINGYGTGLRPPSAEEWEEIANSWYEMKPFGLQETLPVSLDHSSSVHFPPIGNQGEEGSCVAFSVGYYTATFYEACDRSWDLSGAQWVGGYYGAPTASYQDRILSPDFIYHQINKGSASAGSAYQDAMKLISNTGVSSWKEMPYNPNDSKTWPSESAWREAPRYRGHTDVMRVLRVENDQDIQTLKSYINAGYLVSISVDGYKYNCLTANDVWNSNNYTYPSTNHANTIVGYDDLLCGDL